MRTTKTPWAIWRNSLSESDRTWAEAVKLRAEIDGKVAEELTETELRHVITDIAVRVGLSRVRSRQGEGRVQ